MSIILNMCNQKCSVSQVMNGVFLHSTHMPDRVINTLHCTGISISSTSVSCAIKLMLAKTIELLTMLGWALPLIYAFDNFDVQQKGLTANFENNIDPPRRLMSAVIFGGSTRSKSFDSTKRRAVACTDLSQAPRLNLCHIIHGSHVTFH